MQQRADVQFVVLIFGVKLTPPGVNTLGGDSNIYNKVQFVGLFAHQSDLLFDIS